jgi:DNA helicase-2/ATP-dependent DNA helicase PcrA
VTLVNAAADHFSKQVGEYIVERGLLAGVGYRVRTLHGLANDIVRERPGLVGLDKDFKIVDEREADDILQDAVDAWIKTHPNVAEMFITPDKSQEDARKISRDQWPREVKTIASAFIRQAKDEELDGRGYLRQLSTRLRLSRWGRL